jgi:tetratricopeptide (TPR) repeat protein
MSRREELLQRAARCFERAGLFREAGECFRDAGLLVSAGDAFYQADDLLQAAESYRSANEMALAAQLFERIERPVEAAVCWERAGDLVRSGWVLLTRTPRIATAQSLLRKAPVAAGAVGHRLRRDLGLALCRAKSHHDSEALEQVLATCEQHLPRLPDAERALVEEWAVTAATQVGRPDLAGLLLAASYRARTPGAAERWRQWAGQALDGTFGVPVADMSSA